MSYKYILVDRKPVPVDDVIEWSRWIEENRDKEGRVGWDEFPLEKDEREVVFVGRRGKIVVSTVFLGIDHNFMGKDRPVLFETMVFGGVLDDSQERYCTWEEAEAGHKRWVEKVKGTL